MVVPTKPYQERIGPRLLGERSHANKQASIGLYLHGQVSQHTRCGAISRCTTYCPPYCRSGDSARREMALQYLLPLDFGTGPTIP